MWSKTRGFSLPEAIFSLFICSLILFALADALKSAGLVRGNRQGMDQASEIFHVLTLVSADASAALRIITPTVSSSSDSLVLNRVNPRKSFEERIDPLGDELNPYEDSERLRVVYSVADNHLRRATSIPDGSGGPATSESLIGCDEFQVTLKPATLLTVELTVTGLRVDKKRSIKVCLR